MTTVINVSIDSGDCEIFSTVEEAESAVEAIDVQNNEYLFFDSNGGRLTARAVSDTAVKIERPMGEPDPGQLRQFLANHLRVRNIEVIDEANLKSLIEQVLQAQESSRGLRRQKEKRVFKVVAILFALLVAYTLFSRAF